MGSKAHPFTELYHLCLLAPEIVSPDDSLQRPGQKFLGEVVRVYRVRTGSFSQRSGDGHLRKERL